MRHTHYCADETNEWFGSGLIGHKWRAGKI
jgi:hypothetical protein